MNKFPVGAKVVAELEPGRLIPGEVVAGKHYAAPEGCIWFKNAANCVCLLNVAEANVKLAKNFVVHDVVSGDYLGADGNACALENAAKFVTEGAADIAAYYANKRPGAAEFFVKELAA